MRTLYAFFSAELAKNIGKKVKFGNGSFYRCTNNSDKVRNGMGRGTADGDSYVRGRGHDTAGRRSMGSTACTIRGTASGFHGKIQTVSPRRLGRCANFRTRGQRGRHSPGTGGQRRRHISGSDSKWCYLPGNGIDTCRGRWSIHTMERDNPISGGRFNTESDAVRKNTAQTGSNS